MNTIKIAAIICSLLVGFTGTASAASKHHHHSSGCGTTPSNPICTNSTDYSESFYTDDITYNAYWNKSYGSFDAIDVPTLKIESAVLTVNTSANGWFDNFYLKSSTGYFGKIGHLNGGTQSFTLDSKWFNEVMSGLSFKAWFSLDHEFLNWASLDVKGEYCPPSAVPVPASILLFGPALIGFTALRRRAKKS